jgi:hypothetical protein
LAAITIVVMIGFAAFVIDVGQIFRVKNELQNAVDSASLAGARMLNGTAQGIANAQTEALKYAKMHYANSLQIQTADVNDIYVETGHWHEGGATGICTPTPPATGCFESVQTPDSPTYINAVRVTGYRTQGVSHPGGTPNSSVGHFFAQIIGTAQTNVLARATAIGGGPDRDCGFPMVVPDCALENAIISGGCEWCMRFQNATTDTAGWTDFGYNGFPLEQLIAAMCGCDPTNCPSTNIDGITITPGFHVDDSPGGTLECTGQCNSWSTADGDLSLFNGNSMNKNNYCGLIQDILNRDGSGVAKSFKVRVPVIESTAGTCDASQFSSHRPVAGFATVEIMGADCGHGPVIVPNPDESCQPPPSGKFILARLDCDLDSSDIAGGGFFGTEAPHIRLVQ